METRRPAPHPKVSALLSHPSGGQFKVILDLSRPSALLARPRRSLSPLLNSPSLLLLESAMRQPVTIKLPLLQPKRRSHSPTKQELADAKAEMTRFDEDKSRLIRRKNRSRYHTSSYKASNFRLWKAEIAARDLNLLKL